MFGAALGSLVRQLCLGVSHIAPSGVMRPFAVRAAAAGRVAAAPCVRPIRGASYAGRSTPAAASIAAHASLLAASAASAEGCSPVWTLSDASRGFASSRATLRGDAGEDGRRRRGERSERGGGDRASPARSAGSPGRGRRGPARPGEGRPAFRPTLPAPKLSVAIYASWDGSGRRPAVAGALSADARRAVEAALRRRGAPPGEYGVSLSVCDDPSIRELNREWRDVDRPTDVLSVSMLDEGETKGLFGSRAIVGGLQVAPAPSAAAQSRRGAAKRAAASFPACTTLGELAVSLDTASRQALARGTSLRDECRVLLVHGVLHLLGFDHELGERAREAQALEERAVLRDLGWTGVGLVLRSEEDAEQEQEQEQATRQEGKALENDRGTLGKAKGEHCDRDATKGDSLLEGKSSPGSATPPGERWSPSFSDLASLPPVPADVASAVRAALAKRPSLHAFSSASPRPRLLAIDMDGTLLASNNRVPASAALALRLVAASGVTVVLATGKAPYAAREALRGTGLDAATSDAGSDPSPSGVCSTAAPVVDTARGPGAYVQGALVLGPGGTALSGAATLAAGAVRATLEAANDPERVLWVAAEEAPVAGPRAVGLATVESGAPSDKGTFSSEGASPLRARSPLTAVAFMSDGSCAAMESTPRVRELHARYNEPDPAIVGTLERMGGGEEEEGACSPASLRALKMVVLLPKGTRGHEARHGAEPEGALAPSSAPALPPPEAILESLVAPHGARVTVAVPGFLEVVPHGVDKWKALCRLAEALEVDPRDVVCVGDGMNDLEMLQGAGVGVALGGSRAPLALREAADVVAPSADEDGLAIALRAVFLQRDLERRQV